jgi:hypothetical protein
MRVHSDYPAGSNGEVIKELKRKAPAAKSSKSRISANMDYAGNEFIEEEFKLTGG